LRADVALDPGATVRGKVHNPNDLSLGGARLRLLREDWEWSEAEVREDGTFEVPAVRPGNHVVELYRYEGTRFRRFALEGAPHVEILAGDGAIDVTVVRGGGLDVVVKRGHRLPRGTFVTIRDAQGRLSGGSKGALVDRMAAFAARGFSRWALPEGKYRVRFTYPGEEDVEREVEVREGSETTLEIGGKTADRAGNPR
jgi:hypothetical protein